VREVIRGTIGVDGLLISDDISMGSLSGWIGERGRAAIAAECDVLLDCDGRFAAPRLEGEPRRRAIATRGWRRQPSTLDRRAARARFAGRRPSDVGLSAS